MLFPSPPEAATVTVEVTGLAISALVAPVDPMSVWPGADFEINLAGNSLEDIAILIEDETGFGLADYNPAIGAWPASTLEIGVYVGPVGGTNGPAVLASETT